SILERVDAVKAEDFLQSRAWKSSWLPLRATAAEEPGIYSVRVLVLPAGSRISLHTVPEAQVIYKPLFGRARFYAARLADAPPRDLAPGELAVVFKDAFAAGGDSDADCVCRGGRCPRMWGCPFWVERILKERKGSQAWAATRIDDDDNDNGVRVFDGSTVRTVEATAEEPAALLEVCLGPWRLRHYEEIFEDRPGSARELIRVSKPTGVAPGFGGNCGP
ncbi:unnamed protein product, partial [Phaeothamnion confervicola]